MGLRGFHIAFGATVLGLWVMTVSADQHSRVSSYEEQQGMVVIEAEDYASQHLDQDRRWVIFNKSQATHDYPDPDPTHLDGASGGSYIEILPDTRTNHDEALVDGKNFSNEPGQLAILSYPVLFNTPGRYYIWARAYSTGSEDNGVHFGLQGQWPESSARMQWCKGKHSWAWSSAQRREDNHCGEPKTIWLDIPSPGIHNIQVSMREDGVELDKFILTQDLKFQPEGVASARTLTAQRPLLNKRAFFDIEDYVLILKVNEAFQPNHHEGMQFYFDKRREAFAVNAAQERARDRFFGATYVYTKKQTRIFDMVLVTLTEVDGESQFRVKLNGKVIGEFANPETTQDYKEAYFRIPNVSLVNGDIVTVESMAVTNGKIPEGDGTAYARGRWRGLVLQTPKK